MGDSKSFFSSYNFYIWRKILSILFLINETEYYISVKVLGQYNRYHKQKYNKRVLN
jgi:hypothetical protein